MSEGSNSVEHINEKEQISQQEREKVIIDAMKGVTDLNELDKILLNHTSFTPHSIAKLEYRLWPLINKLGSEDVELKEKLERLELAYAIEAVLVSRAFAGRHDDDRKIVTEDKGFNERHPDFNFGNPLSTELVSKIQDSEMEKYLLNIPEEIRREVISQKLQAAYIKGYH